MRARVLLTRFATGLRPSRKRPRRVFVQQCVKPGKSNVSGLPAPRPRRFNIANPPNSTRRVLSGWRLEAEGGQPLSSVANVSLRTPLVPEADHDIVGVTGDDRFAVRVVPAAACRGRSLRLVRVRTGAWLGTFPTAFRRRLCPGRCRAVQTTAPRESIGKPVSPIFGSPLDR